MGSSSSRPSSTSSFGSSLFSSSSTKANRGGSWTDTDVNKLILEKKLAPRSSEQVGAGAEAETRECPICFLDVGFMNTSTCCNQLICTGCYVALVRQKNLSAVCAFCTKPHFGVVFQHDTVPSDEMCSKNTTFGAACPSKKPLDAVSVPLASRADRAELERQISQQSRSFSGSSAAASLLPLSPPRRTTHSSSHYRSGLGLRQGRHSTGSRSESDDMDYEGGHLGSQLLMPRGPSALDTIEQMMLNEAIRLSMAEIPKALSSPREGRNMTSMSSNAAPVQMDRDLVAISIEMSESEQLNLALSLSMKGAENLCEDVAEPYPKKPAAEAHEAAAAPASPLPSSVGHEGASADAAGSHEGGEEWKA